MMVKKLVVEVGVLDGMDWVLQDASEDVVSCDELNEKVTE